MSIDFSRPVQTRDGREVRIFTQNSPESKWPVVGVARADGGWVNSQWNLEGTHWLSPHFSLVNVPQKKMIKGWINIWNDSQGIFRIFSNREKAEVDVRNVVNDGFCRVACKEIKIEFEEGEGLT